MKLIDTLRRITIIVAAVLIIICILWAVALFLGDY